MNKLHEMINMSTKIPHISIEMDVKGFFIGEVLMKIEASCRVTQTGF
jgi:hypothetical protein